MNEKKEKWKNWWWYHKTYVIIGVAAAAVVLYSVLPGLLAPKADYTVAMIMMTKWVPEETRARKIWMTGMLPLWSIFLIRKTESASPIGLLLDRLARKDRLDFVAVSREGIPF